MIGLPLGTRECFVNSHLNPVQSFVCIAFKVAGDSSPCHGYCFHSTEGLDGKSGLFFFFSPTCLTLDHVFTTAQGRLIFYIYTLTSLLEFIMIWNEVALLGLYA